MGGGDALLDGLDGRPIPLLEGLDGIEYHLHGRREGEEAMRPNNKREPGIATTDEDRG